MLTNVNLMGTEVIEQTEVFGYLAEVDQIGSAKRLPNKTLKGEDSSLIS